MLFDDGVCHDTEVCPKLMTSRHLKPLDLRTTPRETTQTKRKNKEHNVCQNISRMVGLPPEPSSTPT